MGFGRARTSSLSEQAFTGNIITVHADLQPPAPRMPEAPNSRSGLFYPPKPTREPVSEWLIDKTWQAFRAEWRLCLMGLGGVPDQMRAGNWELQYLRFAWVREDETVSVVVLFVWRVFTLTWAAVCLWQSVSLLGDGTRWEYHFEHWVLSALVAQYGLELLLVMNGQCVTCIPFYLCLCRLARAVASPLVIHNFLSFIILDIPFTHTITVDDRVAWGLLCPVVCPILDTFLASHRAPRVMHVVYPTMFWVVFVVWSGLYYALVLAEHERVDYPVAVDWGDPLWRVVDLVVNTFLLCPLTVILLWSLMHVRERLRPLSMDEEHDDDTGLPVLTFVGLVELKGMRKSDIENATTTDRVFGRRPSITKLVVERIASASSTPGGSDNEDTGIHRSASASPLRGNSPLRATSASRALPRRGSSSRSSSGNVFHRSTEQFARDLRRERRVSVGASEGDVLGRSRSLDRPQLPYAARERPASRSQSSERSVTASVGKHVRRHSLAALPRFI